MNNNPNNPFSQALDTLTQRWGGWEAPLRVAGATEAYVDLMQSLAENTYQTTTQERWWALNGYIRAALELPPVTLGDLHSSPETIENMVQAFYLSGGKIKNSAAIRVARKRGRHTAETIRFMLFCRERYLEPFQIAQKEDASVTA